MEISKEQKEAIEYLEKYTKLETYGERNLEKDIITVLELLKETQRKLEIVNDYNYWVLLAADRGIELKKLQNENEKLKTKLLDTLEGQKVIKEETKLRIMVEGSTKNTIWQEMDVGGFIEKINGKRVIGFEPCERYFAKRTQGVKAKYTIPELEDGVAGDFLTKLFAEMDNYTKEVGTKMQEERKQCEEVVNTLKPLVENMTIDNVNEVIEAIKTVPHILTSEKEIKAHFAEKIKELNLVWNKEKQQYEVKQEVQNNAN